MSGPGALPRALEPSYTTPRPNAPLKLFRGTVVLSDPPRGRRGRDGVDMVLTANPRIGFHVSAAGPLLQPEDFSDDAEVVLPSLHGAAKMFVDHVQVRSMGRVSYGGLVRGALTVGDGTDLRSAVVHLFNFPNYLGDAVADPSGGVRRARTVLRGGGWQITIDAVPEIAILIRSLRARAGHGITHVAKFERIDAGAFDSIALIEAVNVLGYTLTLARGAWTFPALVVGLTSSGLGRWEECGDRRLDPWDGRLRWFDSDAPECLPTVFAGMWPLWLDPQRQSVLRVATGFLVEASSGISVESRIVLAQAALELLAWQRLVNEGKWSRKQFKSATAAEKIRGLLRACHVDASLPATTAGLASTPGLGSPSDGPSFTVNVRNRVAHPPRTGPHVLLPSSVIVGAWRVALGYHQLALLHWLNFHGMVISPVDLVSRRVPWP